MLLSAAAGACVRQLAGEVPTLELVFFRNVVGLLLLVPWLMRQGLGVMRTSRLPLYCLRVFFAYTAMVMLFYAWGEMPIADVFALQFTIPLFTIMLAVFILKQQTDRQAWAACLIGFAGALIVMRPGVIELTLAAVAAIASAMMSAGSNTTIKLLTRTESVGTITVYSNLLMLPLALIPTFFVWNMPDWKDIPWILALGLCYLLAGLFHARSVQAADARVVQPFNFLRLPVSVIIAFWLFAELPSAWTWLGAALIFAATYYSLYSETARKRKL